MTGNVVPSIIEIAPELLKNLAEQVNETIAVEIPLTEAPKGSFGIFDLWNIQRNFKTISNRLRK